jgi:hypothetical protein
MLNPPPDTTAIQALLDEMLDLIEVYANEVNAHAPDAVLMQIRSRLLDIQREVNHLRNEQQLPESHTR